MTSDRRLAYGLAVLQEPEDGEPLNFTASTTRLNRYGFRLRHEGWRLANFRANPVVLWHHLDFLPPIGRAAPSLADERLNAQVTFDRNDPFAAQVESKYRNKFLHAVSVGFDFTDKAGKPIRNWWSLTPEQIETEAFYDLAEISAVPVPADPGAVRQHHSALSAAGFELLDLAGGIGTEEWLRGTLRPPTEPVGQLAPPAAPTLPGNSTVERRLADLEAEFARLRAAARVTPAHTTAVEDAAWDATAASQAGGADALRACHAWFDGTGDPDAVGSYAFAHHRAPGAPANLAACRAALSALPAADTPEPDRPGVERHLRRHLDAQPAWAPTTDAAQGLLAAVRL